MQSKNVGVVSSRRMKKAAQFDSKAIVIWPYNKLHVLPVVRMLDALAKGRYGMGMKIQKWQQKQD